MSTGHTIMWHCPECPWEEPVSDLSIEKCSCDSPLEPVFTEETVSTLLRGLHALQQRAELFAEAMNNHYIESISFEDCEDIDDSFQIEWEERTCGCCPGEPHWEYIPLRAILEPDFLTKAREIKAEKEEKKRLERVAAAERARKAQEARERAQLRDLQAKYGGAA